MWCSWVRPAAGCRVPRAALTWRRVAAAGGSASLPGLEARLREELRPLVPAGAALRLRTAPAPALAAWRGGAAFAASDAFATVRRSVVERQVASPALTRLRLCRARRWR